MKSVMFAVAGMAMALVVQTAPAATCEAPFRGINLAGAEFAPERLPGVAGRDYRFPTTTHLKYYREAGFDSVRLPVSWERLQPELSAPLDPAYLAGVIRVLDDALSSDMRVVVDVHNYARYRGQVIGSPAVPASAFREFWTLLAAALKDHRALLGYGLMNEPHATDGLWAKVAQSGVDGVRASDRGHYIFVSGDRWSSAELWPKTHPQPFVNDPSDLVIYEGHAYFDANASGRYKTPPEGDVRSVVDKRIKPFADWLAKHRQRGNIGEWGVPDSDPKWLDALDRFVELADTHCLGWFYWAGGNWRPTYELSLEPVDGVDRPQLVRLRAYLKKSATPPASAVK